MNNTSPQQQGSISDAGGVSARQGFKYQDHVAAQCVLNMIEDSSLIRIECETIDDIVLAWSNGSGERLEYVQVKTTEDDKKWSLKEICQRPTGGNVRRPTSLVEKSLLCDSVCCESPRFRIVSRRDVNRHLAPLKLFYDRRKESDQSFAKLGTQLTSKWSTTSPNGRNLSYWAANTYWQVTGLVDGLSALNQQTIFRLGSKDIQKAS